MSEFANQSPFDGRDGPVPSATRRWPIAEVVAVTIVVLLCAGLLLPSIEGRGPSRRSSCTNNLRQISAGLQAYHAVYDTLPPAYTVDSNGKRLHSWRTLILPYIDGRHLYARIDLSKPWDDPTNATLLQEKAPAIYRCPSLGGNRTNTSYLAIVSSRSCLRAGQSISREEITDDLATTIVVFEAPQDRAVHWMSPQDADERLLLSISGKSKLLHVQGFNAAMADSSVKFIYAEASDETLKALSTVDADDQVDGTSLN